MHASQRPHYGGTLRIEMQAVLTSLDPREGAPGGEEEDAKEKILGQVFETLVRLDDKGEPQPLLAVSWSHERARRRWVFKLRRNIVLHDGSAWEPPDGVMSFDDNRSIEDILRDVAQPQRAIVVRGADGTPLGTGPFRIVKWEAGKPMTLAANDTYWGGRPYLDRVEVRFGRAQREQALDFELGKTDITELPLAEVRRTQQQGGRVAMSAPVRVVALVVDSARPDMNRLREALALSIDRAAIRNVLLQRQGESSGGLLPQWLSGYAFLFPTERNLARARELAMVAPPLTLACDRQSPLLASIAERIMLNAGEAGLTLRPAAGGSADVRLAILRISSTDAKQALHDIASSLNAQLPDGISEDPASLYEAERALIASRGVIPLFHLPVAYRVSSHVGAWPAEENDRWRLDEVWIDERRAP